MVRNVPTQVRFGIPRKGGGLRERSIPNHNVCPGDIILNRLTPILLMLWLAGVSVQACQICVPIPKQSAADHLLESDVVVLAREDAERPFHFRAMEILKGRLENEAIDLFLDSGTRRLLASFPERFVVLVGNLDGDKMRWNRIGIADTETDPILRSILDSIPKWKQDPSARVEFFKDLLGHENSQIRTLAHLEIGRAPYGVIRSLGEAFPRDELHTMLADIRYVEWHPLYILLLAQSDHEEDHAYIEKAVLNSARFGSSERLAAWATASIERSGEEGVAFLHRTYFENPNRSPAELKAVIQALSVHGTNGHTHLRDMIVAAYLDMLQVHPSMTPDVVQDAIAWKRAELSQHIETYMGENPGAFCVKISDSIPCSCDVAKASTL